jgi:PPOX class probable F420-dependent enzyme
MTGMRTNLKPEDLGDLLGQPIVATLATYRRNGEVLLSPLWFEWRDGGFNLVLGRNDFKTQHLRRDPRASVVVYENAFPLRGLELRGQARIHEDGLRELRNRIWQHYVGTSAPADDEDVIGVRIEGTVRAWDYADT